jgi:hypothetical protein
MREKRGDTRIDTLRRTYGDSFAPGIRGDAHLKTLLDRTGSNSLSDYLKTTGQSQVSEKRQRRPREGERFRYTLRLRSAV